MSELGREARAIVEAGRAGDDPTSADRARVKSALSRAIVAGAALAATSAASSTASGASAANPKLGATSAFGAAGKVVAVVVFLGVIGAGIALVGTHRSPPPGPARGTAVESPSAEAPPSPAPDLQGAGHPPATPGSPEEGTRTPDPLGDLPAPVLPMNIPLPAERSLASPPPAGRISRSLSPHAPPPSDGPSESAGSLPASPGADPLEAETRGLREARVALQGGDPGHALELLDKQSAAYGQGQLREERAAARVLALCKLGRLEEAASARAAFLRQSPRSPLVDRVRGGCPAAPR